MVSPEHRQRKTDTQTDKVDAGGKNRPVLQLPGHALEMLREDAQAKPQYTL